MPTERKQPANLDSFNQFEISREVIIYMDLNIN